MPSTSRRVSGLPLLNQPQHHVHAPLLPGPLHDDPCADFSVFIHHQSTSTKAHIPFRRIIPSVYIQMFNDSAVTALTLEYRDSLMAIRQDLPHPPIGCNFSSSRARLGSFGLATETIHVTDYAHCERQRSRAQARLVHCAHWYGNPKLRLCLPFCLNMMRGCRTMMLGRSFGKTGAANIEGAYGNNYQYGPQGEGYLQCNRTQTFITSRNLISADNLVSLVQRKTYYEFFITDY